LHVRLAQRIGKAEHHLAQIHRLGTHQRDAPVCETHIIGQLIERLLLLVRGTQVDIQFHASSSQCIQISRSQMA